MVGCIFKVDAHAAVIGITLRPRVQTLNYPRLMDAIDNPRGTAQAAPTSVSRTGEPQRNPGVDSRKTLGIDCRRLQGGLSLESSSCVSVPLAQRIGQPAPVGIQGPQLLVCFQIRFKIRQMHVVIAVGQQRVAQWGENTRFLAAEMVGGY